jgi:hypothetical protein
MKKILLFIAVAAVMVACTNKEEEARTLAVTNLQSWVDSVTSATTEFSGDAWTGIESGYNTAVSAIDESKLNATQKTAFAAVGTAWDTFKGAYTTKVEENKAAAALEATKSLATGLFGDVAMADANDLSFFTAENALPMYQGFCEKAAAAKDTYSPEQWSSVTEMFGKLNNRYDEVSKDVKAGDKLKIAALKAKYAIMFVVEKVKEAVEEVKN